MDLSKEIINNWKSTARSFITKLKSLSDLGYETWTIKIDSSYGVAIPYYSEQEVFERFSDAIIQSREILISGSVTQKVLMLITDKEAISLPFSSLCAEFVYPGDNGEVRAELLKNPVSWWLKWKELVGNKDVDARVYDVLGELVVLSYLSTAGKMAEWNGPLGATYDIDCGNEYYEVKSSISRSKKQVSLSNKFQLVPPSETELYLVFCQFEPALQGYCIDDLVNQLGLLGYSTVILNERLSLMGFEKGRSDRRKKYMLHSMIKYHIDEMFPAIRPGSFIEGDYPKGIVGITYSVSLDGISGEELLNQDHR